MTCEPAATTVGVRAPDIPLREACRLSTVARGVADSSAEPQSDRALGGRTACCEDDQHGFDQLVRGHGDGWLLLDPHLHLCGVLPHEQCLGSSLQHDRIRRDHDVGEGHERTVIRPCKPADETHLVAQLDFAAVPMQWHTPVQ